MNCKLNKKPIRCTLSIDENRSKMNTIIQLLTDRIDIGHRVGNSVLPEPRVEMPCSHMRPLTPDSYEGNQAARHTL